MKTSGLFIVHTHTIPVRYNTPFRLVIFGDVHRDSPDCAVNKWKEFLDYCRPLKDAWYLGMGDYLDSTSTTERECLGHISTKMHETFLNDVQELQLAKCKLFAKEISFMQGKLVGLVNGNHYFDFQAGYNSDQKICELLKTKYLGVCSFIRLVFENGGRKHARDLFVHHGKGAARLVGGSLNRVQQMAEGAEADIYIMGHDHKKGIVPAQNRLFLVNTSNGGLKVEHREPLVARSGSFLASYRDGQVNYNVDECRPPSSLGHVEILFNVRERASEPGSRSRVTEVEMRSLV